MKTRKAPIPQKSMMASEWTEVDESSETKVDGSSTIAWSVSRVSPPNENIPSPSVDRIPSGIVEIPSAIVEIGDSVELKGYIKQSKFNQLKKD